MKKHTFWLILIGFSSFFMAFRPAFGPDLTIENVSLDCDNPSSLVFYVKNQGDKKSKSSSVRVRTMDGDLATHNCLAQTLRNIPILEPGKSFKVSIKLKKNADCDCENGVKVNIFIDYKEQISETDETNNEIKFDSEADDAG